MTNIGEKYTDFIDALQRKVAEITDFEEVEVGAKSTIDKTKAVYILPEDSDVRIVTVEQNRVDARVTVMIVVRGDDNLRIAMQLFQQVYNKLAEDRTLGGTVKDLVIEGFRPEVAGTFRETRLMVYLTGWFVC